MGTLFALLLVLAAIAAVGLALLASSDGGSGARAPDESDVERQIDELRDFIQENTR